ncbi:MAG: hypothetical protein JW776_15260 [Candidatus Lokiarchaeota archaeon]|nr:hypothetical protein [Candidatus Lokiarchaeota archaeon]
MKADEYLVLKIGGEVFENNSILHSVLNGFMPNVNPQTIYVIIAGGGRRCNELRSQYRLDPQAFKNESTYHWKAIKIMGQNAKFIKSQVDLLFRKSNSHLVTQLDRVKYKYKNVQFFNLYKDFKKRDALSHSWQVSSDSIALYYGNLLNSPLCILIKRQPYLTINNEEIKEIKASKLWDHIKIMGYFGNLGKGLVDPMLPSLILKYNIPVLILDCLEKRNLSEFFSKYPDNFDDKDLEKYGIAIYPE